MITIHGKQYVTVAERVTQAHKDQEKISITTELVPNGESVVFKATVNTSKGTFTGFSAANPKKLIEKENPYEVAETSAVGRALGFAGYGSIESIASAEDMAIATRDPKTIDDTDFAPSAPGVPDVSPVKSTCRDCGADMVKNPKTGKWFCAEKCWLGGNS